MARSAVYRIGIVVFDGVKLLDVAGPSEVFSEANRMGAHYELMLCAVGGGPVSSSTGMTISVDADATEAQLRFDTPRIREQTSLGGDHHVHVAKVLGLAQEMADRLRGRRRPTRRGW